MHDPQESKLIDPPASPTGGQAPITGNPLPALDPIGDRFLDNIEQALMN